MDCSNNVVSQECPRKCSCCPNCFNGGTLVDTSSCRCVCKPDTTGPRCEFLLGNPCKFPDDELCSLIDCDTASVDQRFKCPRKCTCCANKMCFNLGN